MVDLGHKISASKESRMWEYFVGLGFFIWLLSVLAFVFWLWMLIDCLQNTALEGTEKIVWILVLIFLTFLES